MTDGPDQARSDEIGPPELGDLHRQAQDATVPLGFVRYTFGDDECTTEFVSAEEQMRGGSVDVSYLVQHLFGDGTWRDTTLACDSPEQVRRWLVPSERTERRIVKRTVVTEVIEDNP